MATWIEWNWWSIDSENWESSDQEEETSSRKIQYSVSQDPWVHRVIVWVLRGVALISLVGTLVLLGCSKNNQIEPSIIALGSASVGALVVRP